ncbi:DUF1878 family protein [Niallia sp. XMNu-256]|uniref:DUF1878 family protein n=1 Tax=Niallia sp. XMNu-256 TaxID=3082444 RepID=UPI0030CECFC9
MQNKVGKDMDLQAILEKINKLEYHQSLLLKMNQSSTEAFYKLIIEKSLSEEEVGQFHKKCERLSKIFEEQKAEGFVYFHPLYEKFIAHLHPKLSAQEVIIACLRQGLYVSLMTEFKKYL